MIPIWSFAVLALLAATVLVLTALRKHPAPLADRDWMEAFSVAKYRPMERLLSERDFEFLASQPGYHPSISRKLRSERRRLFGSYLRCLVRDFQRLYAGAATLAVSAADDRTEFTSTLTRQRVEFHLAVLAIRGRLFLYTFGIGSVDIRGLVESVGELSSRVKQMQPRLT